MTEWQTKPAGELRDHDVVRGHGMVDWTFGLSDLGMLCAHVVTKDPERRYYTIAFPNEQLVEFYRV